NHPLFNHMADGSSGAFDQVIRQCDCYLLRNVSHMKLKVLSDLSCYFNSYFFQALALEASGFHLQPVVADRKRGKVIDTPRVRMSHTFDANCLVAEMNLDCRDDRAVLINDLTFD